MADRVSYEQILNEVAAKRNLKPWEMAFSGQAQEPTPPPAPVGSIADDPMAAAAKREALMKALGVMGPVANPERPGQGNGLLQMLMGLMR